MKKTFLFIFSLLLSMSVLAGDLEEARAIFGQANALYEEQKYEEAKDLYLTLYEDYSSFEYYYNLGNTYYKLDDIPSAILFYEKALKIEPNDDDLNTNLSIANQKVMDKIDAIPLSKVSDFWKAIVAEKNLTIWSIGSIVFIFLAFIFFSLYYIQKRKVSYIIVGIFALLFTGVFYFFSSMTMNRMKGFSEGIIFTPKVDVLNQPNGEQIEFVIHEGTKVILKEVKNDWTEIKIVNGNVGWIPTKDYKEI